MSTDWVDDILQVMEAFRQPIQQYPEGIYFLTRNLRMDLHREEMRELTDAMKARDLTKIADNIADCIVVLLGTAASYGINMRPIWDIVQKANMAKVGGPMRADGKQLKPEGWQPPEPEIESELNRQKIQGSWV